MPRIGWHASHEQVPPSTLLEDARRAEAAGFELGMCSDHFSPWSERQGESGFAWSWLGAALEATSLPFRVVSAPGQRYHPAVLAQAIGTLAEMFPGRLWPCLGSGEALNEHITGERWPPKAVRNERLRESVEVIRDLLAGEEVCHDGLVQVDRARLWTRPKEPPPLIGAAVSAETAAWIAGWADGLVTINQPHEQLARVVEAFRSGGGEGKPMTLQVQLSWAPEEAEALVIAHDQWRTNVFAPQILWDLETVEHFDAVGEFVGAEAVRESVVVSSDSARHLSQIQGAAELGFNEVILHHVGKDQVAFIEHFGEHVLPEAR